jgi:hypothetical protein
MYKWIVILLVSLAGLGLLLVSAHSQEDLDVLDNSWFDQPRRPAVAFSHDEHNEAAELDDCAGCHHVYEGGVKSEDDSSEDQSCGDCHGIKDDGRQPGLMRAFHLNCRGCHLERGKGPVVCAQCHRR